jgi:hypothetical protein
VAEAERGVESSNVTLKDDKAVCEELGIRDVNYFVARGFKADTRFLRRCDRRCSTRLVSCTRSVRDV